MKLKNSTSGILRETDPVMVQRDYVVRPNQPAIVQTRCKWIIGEITEVLDRNTWKLGKIVKMLHNNYFVIRLADCIQLKEFHISSLRVPLQNAPTAPHSKQVHAADKATRRGKQLPADLLRRSGKKRKSTAVLESPQPRQRRSTQPHKVTATADQFLQQHRHHPQSREEETECSVASCSANDDTSDHFATGSDERQRCPIGRGDAMSSAARVAPCTTTSGRESDGVLSDGPPAAAAVDVHVLELEAYRSTVRALHASGPLTWEQESLLTNLRLSLNISNEEHLLQLRHLLSS